ncbi:MAG TPA: CO dehydrogenase/acetyl-CoA synthase subunit delta [Armatimonadota bacterium]|nr:CO dehydrogenase/acetyl-CoA synthase subunit delta [Armatimonadota bacterium]
MAFEMPTERWANKLNTVTIGATAADGGTRTSTVTIGGEETLPFLKFEGATPNPPVIAMEVLDVAPEDLPPSMLEAVGDVLNDPAAWAKKCVDEFGAEMICLRFQGADPEGADKSPEECGAVLKSVLEAVGVPLIIWGCGDYEKDNNLIPVLSQAAAGERCALGSAVQDNYKTIAACSLADGHLVISEAPLDIQIQKQVNILLTDMGMAAENIIMFQTTGGLGYGVEYAFSIMERTRLASLGGDRMMSMPMLAVVGSECWKTKEARLSEEEAPEWGDAAARGPIWEAATANMFVHGGTDILVMWHPQAVTAVKSAIADLSGEGS